MDGAARFTGRDGRAASVREMLPDMIEEYARQPTLAFAGARPGCTDSRWT